MSRLKNFSRNITTSYLQMGVNVVYSLVSVPLALHWLPKAEFGIWAILIQFTVYAYLLDLGINQAISRFLIDHKDERSTGEYGALVKTSALVSAIQGLIVVLAVIWSAPLLSELLKIPPEYRDAFVSVTRWQGAITGFTFCLNPFVIMLSAHQRMDIQAWQAMIGMAVSLVLLVLFFVTGHGIFSLVYAGAITALISPCFYFWSCGRLGLIPKGQEWGELSWGRFEGIFLYGKDVFLMGLGANLISASQTIVVSRAIGLEAAATWSVGTKVFTLVRQVMFQPTSSALPGLSEMLARNETGRLRRRFESLAGVTVSFAVFLGVAYALCNSPFVEVWTNGKVVWSPMNDILLALWLFFTSVQTTHSSFLYVSKQIGRFPFVFIAEGLTYITLAALVGGRWGIPGIIVCSVVCVIVFSCYFSIKKSKEFFQVSSSTLLLEWLRPAFRLAAVLVPLATALWFVTAGLPVAWRLCTHCVGAICGAPLLLHFGLPREFLNEVLPGSPDLQVKKRIRLYIEGSAALKFLVPIAQYFLLLRFKLRERIACELLRFRLVWLWIAKRRPLLLFARFGGIGDIICSIPAYSKICDSDPTKHGVFITHKAYRSLPQLCRAPGSVCHSGMHCRIPWLPRWVVCKVFVPQYSDELGLPAGGSNLVDEFYRSCGLQPDPEARPRFHFSPGSVDSIRATLGLGLPGPAKVVAIHTGPSWKVREWPEEHWQALVDGLLMAVPGVRIFQVGSNAYLNVGVAAPPVRNVESLVGKLRLDEMAALLSEVDLFVGIDSGMIHMAAAAGAPTVGLFGPTDPGRIQRTQRTAALWHGLQCSFCHHRQPRLHFQTGCPYDVACMKGLAPERVLQACLRLLNSVPKLAAESATTI